MREGALLAFLGPSISLPGTRRIPAQGPRPANVATPQARAAGAISRAEPMNPFDQIVLAKKGLMAGVLIGAGVFALKIAIYAAQHWAD